MVLPTESKDGRIRRNKGLNRAMSTPTRDISKFTRVLEAVSSDSSPVKGKKANASMFSKNIKAEEEDSLYPESVPPSQEDKGLAATRMPSTGIPASRSPSPSPVVSTYSAKESEHDDDVEDESVGEDEDNDIVTQPSPQRSPARQPNGSIAHAHRQARARARVFATPSSSASSFLSSLRPLSLPVTMSTRGPYQESPFLQDTEPAFSSPLPTPPVAIAGLMRQRSYDIHARTPRGAPLLVRSPVETSNAIVKNIISAARKNQEKIEHENKMSAEREYDQDIYDKMSAEREYDEDIYDTDHEDNFPYRGASDDENDAMGSSSSTTTTITITKTIDNNNNNNSNNNNNNTNNNINNSTSSTMEEVTASTNDVKDNSSSKKAQNAKERRSSVSLMQLDSILTQTDTSASSTEESKPNNIDKSSLSSLLSSSSSLLSSSSSPSSSSSSSSSLSSSSSSSAASADAGALSATDVADIRETLFALTSLRHRVPPAAVTKSKPKPKHTKPKPKSVNPKPSSKAVHMELPSPATCQAAEAMALLASPPKVSSGGRIIKQKVFAGFNNIPDAANDETDAKQPRKLPTPAKAAKVMKTSKIKEEVQAKAKQKKVEAKKKKEEKKKKKQAAQKANEKAKKMRMALKAAERKKRKDGHYCPSCNAYSKTAATWIGCDVKNGCQKWWCPACLIYLQRHEKHGLCRRAKYKLTGKYKSNEYYSAKRDYLANCDRPHTCQNVFELTINRYTNKNPEAIVTRNSTACGRSFIQKEHAMNHVRRIHLTIVDEDGNPHVPTKKRKGANTKGTASRPKKAKTSASSSVKQETRKTDVAAVAALFRTVHVPPGSKNDDENNGNDENGGSDSNSNSNSHNDNNKENDGGDLPMPDAGQSSEAARLAMHPSVPVSKSPSRTQEASSAETGAQP